MRATISFTSTTLSAENLHGLVHRFRQQLDDISGIQAGQVARPARPPGATEEKAEPVTLLSIALAFLTTGAAASFISALRSVDPDARDGAIAYEVDLGDDAGKVKLKASGLARSQLERLINTFDAIVDAH